MAIQNTPDQGATNAPWGSYEDQRDKNLLVCLDCIHLGFGFNFASIRRRSILTLEWEPVVEDQLNRKEVNDEASEGLVNPPKRVRIDRLMVA